MLVKIQFIAIKAKAQFRYYRISDGIYELLRSVKAGIRDWFKPEIRYAVIFLTRHTPRAEGNGLNLAVLCVAVDNLSCG